MLLKRPQLQQQPDKRGVGRLRREFNVHGGERAPHGGRTVAHGPGYS